MRALAFSFLVLGSGCAIVVKQLEPHPNIPPQTNPPPIGIALAEAVQQALDLDFGDRVIEFRTFRGDLKRAFFSGYPGATAQPASLVLELHEVSPEIENLGVARIARLRFRGLIRNGELETAPFAGRVESPVCSRELKECFRTAIEVMFEKIYAESFKPPTTRQVPPRTNET